MKQRLYWRPHQGSRSELLFLTACSIALVWAVQHFQVIVNQPHYEAKLAAAALSQTAMETIKAERIKRGHTVDLEVDPTDSGLIGALITATTSNAGLLAAKQTTVNPNWAALVVDYLERVGLREGDLVGVGFSGSFPAINIAVLSALETLKLEPIIISSAAASQWGANDPELLWIDMERVLHEHGVFSHRSVAASRGGILDRGVGISSEGQALLDAAIRRNGLQRLYAGSLEASVEQRMRVYRTAAAGRRFKAYVNVGGSATSVGTHVGKKLYAPGLNRKPPRGAGKVDSVMNRFSFEGLPVIHMVQIKRLAERYRFPYEPKVPPPLGQGRIFQRRGYNRWLAGIGAGGLLFLVVAVTRTDWGFRFLRISASRADRKPPEQMV